MGDDENKKESMWIKHLGTIISITIAVVSVISGYVAVREKVNYLQKQVDLVQGNEKEIRTIIRDEIKPISENFNLKIDTINVKIDGIKEDIKETKDNISNLYRINKTTSNTNKTYEQNKK
jgi:methyl-accepting chemotaxis protein